MVKDMPEMLQNKVGMGLEIRFPNFWSVTKAIKRNVI